MRKSTKRIATIAVAAAVVIGGASAAWAIWSKTGSTTVYASAGQMQALTVVQEPGTALVGLVPGVPQSVTVRVSNPNNFPVRINGVSAPFVTVTAQGPTGGGCNSDTTSTTGNHGIILNSPVPAEALSTIIPANQAAFTYTINNAIKLTNTSDDACQGAAFEVKFNVTSVSAAS